MRRALVGAALGLVCALGGLAVASEHAAPPPVLHVRQLPDGGRAVSRAELNLVLDDPKATLTLVRVVPAIRDPGPSGLRVYAAHGAPLLKQLGLQNADVLLTVDGVEVVNNKDWTALGLALRDPKKSQIELGIIRGETSMTITIAIVE